MSWSRAPVEIGLGRLRFPSGELASCGLAEGQRDPMGSMSAYPQGGPSQSETGNVPQRDFVRKILPNFRVNFLVRFASKPLLYWQNARELFRYVFGRLVLFVRFFRFVCVLLGPP